MHSKLEDCTTLDVIFWSSFKISQRFCGTLSWPRVSLNECFHENTLIKGPQLVNKVVEHFRNQLKLSLFYNVH